MVQCCWVPFCMVVCAQLHDRLPLSSSSFLAFLLTPLTHASPPTHTPPMAPPYHRPDKGDALFQRDGPLSCIYLKLLTLQTSDGEAVRFVGNTYISADQGDRLFVREDALTNSKLAGNKVVAELIKDELKQLRVSETSAEQMMRDEGQTQRDSGVRTHQEWSFCIGCLRLPHVHSTNCPFVVLAVVFFLP